MFRYFSLILINIGFIFQLGCYSEPKAVEIASDDFENAHKKSSYYLFAKHYQLKNDEEIALSWIIQSAKLGFAPAQRELGIYYLTGNILPKNDFFAGEWFTKSAQQGDKEAIYYLAVLYLEGKGVPPNLQVAQELLNLSAEGGEIKAILKLGDLYRKGGFGEGNKYKADYWYQQAMKTAQGQYHLATLILANEWESAEDPILLLTKAANENHPLAQLELAKLYQHYIHNEFLAFQWYQRAAAYQIPEACYELAKCYLEGKCMQSINIDLAVHYLKKAATKNHLLAQQTLAFLYLDGKAVLSHIDAINYLNYHSFLGMSEMQVKLAQLLVKFSLPEYDKAAFHWLNVAAKQQNQQAEYLLANSYFEGVGVEIDYKKAFQIFFKLANKNHPLSQCKLGKMYYYGQGIEKDFTEAKKWIVNAAAQGIEEAQIFAQIMFNEENNNLENNTHFNKWAEYNENEKIYALYIKGRNILFGKEGYEQDTDEGLKLINAAADLNLEEAQQELNKFYQDNLFDLEQLSNENFNESY